MAISVGELRSRALGILNSAGNSVAAGGTIVGSAIDSAGKALKDAAGKLESPALRQGAETAAAALEQVGGIVSGTFAMPGTSKSSSTNFQAGQAAAFDAAFLAVGTASNVFPGLHLVGAASTMSWGAFRLLPGLIAQHYGRTDAQTCQAIQAGKLVLAAGVIMALTPPLVGAAAVGSAMTVSARNAHTLITAEAPNP